MELVAARANSEVSHVLLILMPSVSFPKPISFAICVAVLPTSQSLRLMCSAIATDTCGSAFGPLCNC